MGSCSPGWDDSSARREPIRLHSAGPSGLESPPRLQEWSDFSFQPQVLPGSCTFSAVDLGGSRGAALQPWREPAPRGRGPSRPSWWESRKDPCFCLGTLGSHPPRGPSA